MATIRQLALADIRVAAYHDDTKTAVRIFTENRISRATPSVELTLRHGRRTLSANTTDDRPSVRSI